MNDGGLVYGVVLVATVLFGIGAWGVIARRNLIVVLLSLEVMLNAANLLFVAFARYHGGGAGQVGQVFALFVMALAAAEAAVGLAILIVVFRARRSLDTTDLSLLKG